LASVVIWVQSNKICFAKEWNYNSLSNCLLYLKISLFVTGHPVGQLDGWLNSLSKNQLEMLKMNIIYQKATLNI